MSNTIINVTKSELPEIEKYQFYLKKIWQSAWLTNNGELVQELEKKIKYYLNVPQISLLSNGTIALQLAIKALDIKGEVITTPYTFAATTNVIIWEKATPVFADIDPETYNIDPEDIERKITKKTSAILAVHVYGNPCNVEKIEKIAQKYKLKVIYDAAHAFGVKYKNKSLLEYGDISTLSFHATKVFNTIEGGAIVSKNKSIIEKVNLLRNFGIISEEKVVLPGINAKMNEFQAAMGLCNLESLNKKIHLRKAIYNRYLEGLKSNKNLKFQKVVSSYYNYSYMPICFNNIKLRNLIFKQLLTNNIKTRKYFYPPTSSFEYFRLKKFNLINTTGLCNSNKIANGILCLPIYSSLNLNIVDKIIQIINSICS